MSVSSEGDLRNVLGFKSTRIFLLLIKVNLNRTVVVKNERDQNYGEEGDG